MLLQGSELQVRYGGGEPVVHGVDLELQPGERYALVGESGSGKSSLLRGLLGLAPLTAGSLLWKGQNAVVEGGGRSPDFRRRVQMIYQDPFSSFHPRLTVLQNLLEPLRIHRIYRTGESEDEARATLAKVGLDPTVGERRPRELSGGQLQRAALARALLPKPELLIADEPVSALDVSVQAQVLNLLADLSEELRLAILMVSHDLGVVVRLCRQVYVFQAGRVVESGAAAQVCFEPEHRYTRRLVEASATPSRAPRALRGATGEEEVP